MIFGLRDGSEYRNVSTVTEFEDFGENVIQIVERNDKFSYPKEWKEYYKYTVLRDNSFNRHTELNDRYDVYSYIKKFVGESDKVFAYTKYTLTANINLDLDQILTYCCDYIISEELSLKGRFYSGNIPVLLNNDNICFSISGIKYVYDTMSKSVIIKVNRYTDIKAICPFYDSMKNIKIDNYSGKFLRMVKSEDFVVNSLFMPDNSFSTILEICKNNITFNPMFSGESVKVFFTCSKSFVNINIQRCSCEREYQMICMFFDKLINMYNDKKKFFNVELELNSLKTLREYDSFLFINNYTRVCSRLPSIYVGNVTTNLSFNGFDYIDDKLVIEYPFKSGKYYTSEYDSSYVGLKVNTLENSSMYPYLVTVYDMDHMNTQNRNTYKYYRYVHTTLNNNTILSCIKNVLEDKPFQKKVFCAVTLQENYHKSCLEDETLGTEFVSRYLNENNKEDDFCMIRIYEELYNINIIVLSKNDTLYMANVIYPYYYNIDFQRKTLVVVRNNNLSISDGKYNNFSYSIVVFDTITEKDKFYSYYISDNKYILSEDTFEDDYSPISQCIDLDGKRQYVELQHKHTGEVIYLKSIGRPLNIPYKSYYNKHINILKNNNEKTYLEIGLRDTSQIKNIPRDYIFYSSK